ncbi:MAG: hypothetical protein ACK5FT_06590 [Sphingomonadales bacterium]|jgi:hypothetical protein
MSHLQDITQNLFEMGFEFDPMQMIFRHNSGLNVLFIPAAQTVHNEPVSDCIVLHEDIWKNRKAAVINRLLSLTGHTHRIHGRQCTVKRIDLETSRLFLEQYHTGGFVNSYFKYGLFYRDELISVGLFSKCRTFQTSKNLTYKSAELTRYACKTEIRITGGLDKLLNTFCREYEVNHLMTYADKEWTDGKSYFTLGFEKIAETPPLQFLVHKQTGQRIPAGEKPDNPDDWILKSNLGNLKLIRIKNPRP